MAVLPPVQPSTPVAAVSSEGFENFVAVTMAGAGPTACYTAGSATERRISKIKRIVIHNTTAAPVNITVSYYKASTATVYEWYGATSLAADTQLPFNEPEWVMESADELRVTGAANVNVFVTAREYHGNVKP